MKPVHGRSRFVFPAVLAGAVALAGPAALAQTDDLARSDHDERFTDGLEDIPGQVEQALRGLIDRMKPMVDDATDLMDVLGEIDSPQHYDKPVILPNGDILIRRSPDAPEWDADENIEDRPRPRHLDPNEGTPI